MGASFWEYADTLAMDKSIDHRFIHMSLVKLRNNLESIFLEFLRIKLNAWSFKYNLSVTNHLLNKLLRYLNV